ncbi:MAG: 16S rRNA (guanine(527)-N(7))-methyltransferase RsmG, partial [Clostridia bacterium]|nr:16S rRNA (guanine(527)-N(7))-methyltransferase RsmG [Clostridia bacterium]
EQAKRAIPQLGGELVKVASRTLSDGVSDPIRHAVVVVEKRRSTPPNFPRPYARMLKKPL